MTTKEDIRDWLKAAKRQKAAYMIVACDTFDHEDYPINCATAQECTEKYKKLIVGENMQRVMEVYDMSLDINKQLAEGRAMNLPR